MFTGIITDIGIVRKLHQAGDLEVTIETAWATDDIDIGASVACSGVCLTVVSKSANSLSFDVSHETVSRSNLGQWADGTRVNLERALKVGDELGGHIVTGHVDGLATIMSIEAAGDSKRFVFSFPEGLDAFIAEKGSVTLNGTSLTVNDIMADGFSVNLVPHTQKMTTFGDSAVGDKVNVEIDVLARYLKRMNDVRQSV